MRNCRGEPTPSAEANRGPSDPGWRRSSLASINGNDKQNSVWRQLVPVFLFILNQIHMFRGADAATDVSIRKTWRELRHNNKFPQHWDVLELVCTQWTSSPFSLIISLMRLCLPPALTHRGTTVKLGVHFEWCTGAPVRLSPLALQLNREDGVIRTLPGGCQLVLGRADRVASWRVDACPCQAPMQRLPSVDICCMRKNCVEFVCGCILILHLCSLGLAERTSSSARLASINCPCLARCLLLIILINFNSPGSHRHSSCSFFFL